MRMEAEDGAPAPPAGGCAGGAGALIFSRAQCSNTGLTEGQTSRGRARQSAGPARGRRAREGRHLRAGIRREATTPFELLGNRRNGGHRRRKARHCGDDQANGADLVLHPKLLTEPLPATPPGSETKLLPPVLPKLATHQHSVRILPAGLASPGLRPTPGGDPKREIECCGHGQDEEPRRADAAPARDKHRQNHPTQPLPDPLQDSGHRPVNFRLATFRHERPPCSPIRPRPRANRRLERYRFIVDANLRYRRPTWILNDAR